MAILSFTGQAQEIDISDFWLDDATGNKAFQYSNWWATASADSLLFFNEAQNVTLSEDIKISNPQDWEDLNNLGTIEAGTAVDSHFIYFKNDKLPGEEQLTRRTLTATFTFDGEIIGFIADDELFGNAETLETLNGNDELVGYRARVIQEGNTLEGPEFGDSQDIVRILGENNNILEVTFTSQSAVDPLRVITLAQNIELPNTAPLADNDSYSTGFQSPLVVNADLGVLNGDTDADGDALTASLVTQPNNGTVELNEDGSFTYSPNAGFSGNDSFSYSANDGEDSSNVASVT
ncbi:Ig-like domain-containing protein, partial [Limnoraphis robusta]|uniref:Ig-like domain-containing protein n=1 Tax=Limnoraphis robusta TaxID=1118279 RepID=UPI002B1EC970